MEEEATFFRHLPTLFGFCIRYFQVTRARWIFLLEFPGLMKQKLSGWVGLNITFTSKFSLEVEKPFSSLHF